MNNGILALVLVMNCVQMYSAQKSKSRREIYIELEDEDGGTAYLLANAYARSEAIDNAKNEVEVSCQRAVSESQNEQTHLCDIAAQGFLEPVQSRIEQGGDVYAKKDGKTPLDCARECLNGILASKRSDESERHEYKLRKQACCDLIEFLKNQMRYAAVYSFLHNDKNVIAEGEEVAKIKRMATAGLCALIAEYAAQADDYPTDVECECCVIL